MQIFIEPSDVLLFRDGRPFSAGEGHRARSIFPPTPNTIQGVIRSKVLAERCGRYQDYRNGCLNCPENNNCSIPIEIGTPAQNHYGNLEIKGTLIAKYRKPNLTIYFPVPADIVRVKNKNNPVAESKLRHLSPLRKKIPGSNDLAYSLHSLWSSETTPVEAVQGYWTQQNLVNYLLGNNLENPDSPDTLYQRESRFGIEIDNNIQAVKEGKIYQTEFIRCQENIGLYVEFKGITNLSAKPDLDTGLIGIGGENRVASYTKISGIDWHDFREKLINKLKQSDGFKLYLTTPTIFDSKHKQGWLPKWINPNTLSGEYERINLKLIAATISGYQTIGGWDVAHNKQKPTRRAVMAGSVYYFQTEATAEEILEAFHWQNLADEKSEAQIGYGLSLVGSWNYCKFTEEK
jgi:CRISPR-associated protein Cmr3